MQNFANLKNTFEHDLWLTLLAILIGYLVISSTDLFSFPNTNWLPITLLSSVLIAQQNAFALAHHHHHTEISCSLSISCLFGGFFLHNWLLQLIFKEILMCTLFTNHTINFLHFSHSCFFQSTLLFQIFMAPQKIQVSCESIPKKVRFFQCLHHNNCYQGVPYWSVLPLYSVF